MTNAIRVENKSNVNIAVPVNISGIKTQNQATAVYVGKDSNLTIAKKLSIKNIEGKSTPYLFPKGIELDGQNSSIEIAEVDISDIDGVGLFSGKNSKIQGRYKTTLSVAGGKITTAEDASNSKKLWAVYAYERNILLNKDGTHKLLIKGNMFADSSNNTSSDRTIDVSLTTNDSAFTGAIKSNKNGFNSKGITKLTLKHGATWTHEVQSGVLKADNTFKESHLTEFTGGAKENEAGIIKQGEKDILIDKYSGNTRVIFQHDADNPLSIKGGDIKIKNALDNSAIILNTAPSAKITSTNAKDVLNALAEKLTYENYAEKKLKGRAEINEGLLSSSATFKGEIGFGTNKKGTVNLASIPSTSTEQQKREFTKQITSGKVQEYIDDHVEDAGKPGAYKFTLDTKIKSNVYNGAIYGDQKGLTIDATGKNLTIDAEGTAFITGIDVYGGTGFSGKKSEPVHIKAQKLTINTHTTGSKTYGIWTQNDGKLLVKGETIINATGKNDAEVSGIEATGRSTISLQGITINQTKGSEKYHAIRNTGKGSKVFVNLSEDKRTFYDQAVDIKGNILTHNDLADKEEDYAETNLALTTANSSFRGTLRIEKGRTNFYLSNNATWHNEHYATAGKTSSHVTELVGGSEESKAGNIHMNTLDDLSIDKYMGHMNFFFTHESTDPAKISAGNVKIKKAEEDSHVTFITDHTGVNSTNLEKVLNVLAGKLYYLDSDKSHNLKPMVKVLEGLTASSTMMRYGSGYIVFDDATHQGKYQKTKPNYDVQSKDTFLTPITNDKNNDGEYVRDHVRKIDGSYVFTKDKTTIQTDGKNVSTDIYATITNEDIAHKPLKLNL